MDTNNETRLDQNVKRIDVGALVTVANVSTDKRHCYFISPNGESRPSLNGRAPLDIVTANTPIAKILIGKMKGDKIFFRHDLMIEFIEWPSL